MLIDTCLFIEHFRGNTAVSMFLSQHAGSMHVSAITDMELAQGVRNKQELQTYYKLLKVLKIELIEINEPISTLAREWVRQYGLSHNLNLADALIAATAKHSQLTLYTNNIRDFQFLDVKLSNL
jgi:predicted nucleic acid-binding protein